MIQLIQLIQLLIDGMSLGSVYVLLGMGFVLVFKCSQTLNFAQGGFVLVGGYMCWAFGAQLGLPFWISFLLAIGVAFALGFALERFPLRPIIGESPITLFMLTLGLYAFFVGIVTLIWSGVRRQFPQLLPAKGLLIGDVVISYHYLAAFLICLLILAMLALFFRFSITGLRMRSVAESRQIAQSIGVSVRRVIAISWGLAAVLGVVAGVILGMGTALHLGMAELGLVGIAVAMVGGFESIGGAFIAGLMLGVIETLVGGYISYELSTIVAFAILLLVLLLRPHGLFGLETIERL